MIHTVCIQTTAAAEWFAHDGLLIILVSLFFGMAIGFLIGFAPGRKRS